jgi:hypothetical protein
MKTLYLLIVLFAISDRVRAGDNHPCVSKIEQSICPISSVFQWDSNQTDLENLNRRQNLECIGDSSIYLNDITEVFNELPAQAKNAFCYIERIYIIHGETRFGGQASWAFEQTGEIDDEGYVEVRHKGFILWLSKKYRFDLKESNAEFMTRSLQQYSFQVDVFNDGLDPRLPVWHQTDGPHESSLYTTILHEIGHFIDFALNLTSSTIRIDQNGNHIRENEWAKFSWFWDITSESYKPVIDAIIRRDDVPMDNWRLYVDTLMKSRFVSSYATTSLQEDFAETYAAFNSLASYELISSENEVLYTTYQSRNDAITQKYEFIDRIEYDPFSNGILNQRGFRVKPEELGGFLGAHCMHAK